MTETSPDLAERYLAELDRLLTHADPDERADVVASVREHIEAALAEQTASGRVPDVAAVLAGLGSPEQVAGGVRGDGRPAGTTPLVVAARAATLTGTWVAPVACLLLIVGALGSIVFVPLLLWVGGAILMAASPLWTTREKVLALVVSPIGWLAVVVGATVSLRTMACRRVFGGSGTLLQSTCSPGSNSGRVVVLVVFASLVVAAFAYVVVLWRRGAVRAERLSAPATVG
jgi:hypothetical protein